MTLAPVKISLDDYVRSGGGANGESYDCKADPDLMLKLYFPGKVTQPLDEMTLARKVYDLGIPTPEPGDYVVTEDGRYGIRFRRIPGKKSYSRATADEPEKVGRFAEEFAVMCLLLHSIHVDTTAFENVKDRYFRLLEANPFFTTAEKDRIGRFIDDAPDTDTAIHGDLQFSNAIFAGDRRYFIDLRHRNGVSMLLPQRRRLHPGDLPHAQGACGQVLGVLRTRLFRPGPPPEGHRGGDPALCRPQDTDHRTGHPVPYARVP